MKESMSAKSKGTIPLKEVQPTSRETKPSGGLAYQVTVRFYRRMKPQRVYPLRVELSRAAKGTEPTFPPPEPVLLRPVIAGAHVSPAKIEVSVGATGAQTIFHVTPLARGWLPDARLQISQPGQPVQEVRLPMKGSRQLLTWVLAALTVLIPAALLYLTSLNLTTNGPHSGLRLTQSTERTPGVGPPDAEGLAKAAREAQRGPIERYIILNVPQILPESDALGGSDLNYTPTIAAGVQKGYDLLYMFSFDKLSFWIAVVLLIATGVSWINHRPVRRRRVQPVTLASGLP